MPPLLEHLNLLYELGRKECRGFARRNHREVQRHRNVSPIAHRDTQRARLCSRDSAISVIEPSNESAAPRPPGPETVTCVRIFPQIMRCKSLASALRLQCGMRAFLTPVSRTGI